jgi:hypothetical protein
VKENFKIAFDIIVALFAIAGGLYAGFSWIGDHLESMQRVHLELRLDDVKCVPNDGQSSDANGGPAAVVPDFKRICTVVVNIQNVGSVDFTGRGDALFFVCQSSPLRLKERAAPPYVHIAGPVREEPADGKIHVHTYSDNIVQYIGELKPKDHFNMRFTAYTRADDNAGIALQPYLPGVKLSAETPTPADPSLCRNGETN